jgi:PAT family beta-lactamase induction signal transducer AmpG
MTDTTDAPAAAVEPRRKRSPMEVLRALGQPKVAVMLALGFSSGLPFMLFGNTLGFWLGEHDVKLSAIGYLSWAGLPFLWKFVWGAIVDHTAAPLLVRLGQRRSWLIFTQVCAGLGLLGMALTGPSHLPWLGFFAVLTGIASAMQDTVVDAWRIEIASDADELGLLTSSYSLGYRGALILSEAVILLVATAVGWALSYVIYALLMAVGVIAALLAAEPKKADEVMARNAAAKPPASFRGAWDAVAGPFVSFFRTHGWGLAPLMLLMITLYHLCDYLRGPMGNPYYIALGISKPTIAAVRGAMLPVTLLGIAAGGTLSLRIGGKTTLLLGAIVQPIGVGLFALLGWHGSDFTLWSAGGAPVSAFVTIMGLDAFFIGFSGVALIAYISSLTNLGYTATQYALLTSAMAWSGKLLKGFSGDIVESLQHSGLDKLHAFAWFYVIAAGIGVPAILACAALLIAAPSAPRGAVTSAVSA